MTIDFDNRNYYCFVKKILYLGDAGSPHLARWVKLMYERGFGVAVFSFRHPSPDIANLSGVHFEVYEELATISSASMRGKLGYLKSYPALRRLVRKFHPDLVHAHYASSYGLLASMLSFHPFVLSVWGSDVFAFGESFLGRMILRYNFSKADRILSTSEVMKKRVMQFCRKEIEVTPFGVDLDVFFPGKADCPFFNDAELVFGMIKTMDHIYGVDIVLHAFKQVLAKFPKRRIKLLLVGGGDTDKGFLNLSDRLGISAHVHFTGKVEQSDVPEYHRMIDVFLNPSRAESFGVAVLEAMASGRAVIVTNTGGLAEIVTNEVNGLHCDVGNSESLAERMIQLLENAELRADLATRAREHVMRKFNKSVTDDLVIQVYNELLLGMS